LYVVGLTGDDIAAAVLMRRLEVDLMTADGIVPYE